MSEKWTPGPWEVHHDPTDQWHTRRVYAADDRLVANIVPRHNPEADARLIACAPELFKALQNFITHTGHTMRCDEFRRFPGRKIACTPECEQARAALARAEGRDEEKERRAG